MASITIQGDKRIVDITRGVSSFLQNPRQAMKKTGDFLIEEYTKNFDSEGARLQNKWKSLARSTQLQRTRLGFGASSPILQRTGKLKAGFRKQVRRFSVRVHNPVEYFQYHQRGGGKLPERVMISAPEKLKQEVLRIIRLELDKKLRGV